MIYEDLPANESECDGIVNTKQGPWLIADYAMRRKYSDSNDS